MSVGVKHVSQLQHVSAESCFDDDEMKDAAQMLMWMQWRNLKRTAALPMSQLPTQAQVCCQPCPFWLQLQLSRQHRLQVHRCSMAQPSTADAVPSPPVKASAPTPKPKPKPYTREARVPTPERYDMSRRVGVDGRDPRAQGFPCYGHHSPIPEGRGSLSGRNGHGKWTTCSLCHLRLGYVSWYGATGTYRQAGPLPPDFICWSSVKSTVGVAGMLLGSLISGRTAGLLRISFFSFLLQLRQAAP